MNRKKLDLGTFESMASATKELFHNKFSDASRKRILLSVARFRGQLGATVAVILSLVVGFLTVPNNVLYFIDHSHSARISETGDDPLRRHADHRNAHIHAGIALVALGFLAMVASIVLSYFAAKSERKSRESQGRAGGWDPEFARNHRAVMACLVLMNVELFMAVIAGCMEMLYRPLTADADRLHGVECAVAAFNICIYLMYVPTMLLISSVLKAKRDRPPPVDLRGGDFFDPAGAPSARDYMLAGRSANPYNSHSSIM